MNLRTYERLAPRATLSCPPDETLVCKMMDTSTPMSSQNAKHLVLGPPRSGSLGLAASDVHLCCAPPRRVCGGPGRAALGAPFSPKKSLFLSPSSSVETREADTRRQSSPYINIGIDRPPSGLLCHVACQPLSPFLSLYLSRPRTKANHQTSSSFSQHAVFALVGACGFAWVRARTAP